MTTPFNNGDELAKEIQSAIQNSRQIQASNNTQEDKSVKIARLVVILVKIEKELTTIDGTLHKLWEHQRTHNPNSPLVSQIAEKMNTVDRLKNKIVKARLNLNWHFL